MALPTLSLGMRGPPVEALQRLLESFYAQLRVSPGAADGIFGDRTLRAVKALQTEGKITADGIVGPTTWKLVQFAASPGMWSEMQRLLTAPLKPSESGVDADEVLLVDLVPAGSTDVPLPPAGVAAKKPFPWGLLGGAAAIGTGVWLWRK